MHTFRRSLLLALVLALSATLVPPPALAGDAPSSAPSVSGAAAAEALDGLRDRLFVLEHRLHALEAELMALRARVAALEARSGA